MIPRIGSFLLGIILIQQFTNLPDINWCWFLLLLLLLPFLPRPANSLDLMIYFMSGFLWALLRVSLVLDNGLADELQGKDLLATGLIVSIPVEDDRKIRFEYQIENLKYKNKTIKSPGKISLSLYINRKLKTTKLSLKAGQRWRFWLRLKQPHGFINPGSFDYEGWMFQNKIRASGYVRINSKKNQVANKLESSSYSLLSIRQGLYDKLKTATKETHFGGVIIALAIGERSAISKSQWKVFRATGTSHLVAISGLHIGLLAAFVFYITLRLWPLIPFAANKLASPRAAALISLLLASFYALLSGFAIPSQRALVMLCIIMLAIFRMDKVQNSKVLSLALLFVLLLDPLAVLSPGFWLSFAAVSIIAISGLGRIHGGTNQNKKWNHKFKMWGVLQWRISLALIPLLMFIFQQASLVSPIANLIAIPVVSFIVVPLVLFTTAFISLLPDYVHWIYLLSDQVLSGLWWVLAWLAQLPWSEWQGTQPALLPLMLASFGFALLLTPKGWPLKYLGLFLVLPLLWPDNMPLNQGEVEVTLLDVGQGLATVVLTQKHTLVFDTGPKFSQNFDTGEAVVAPFLRHKGLNEIDLLVVSHQDNDHRGGVDSLRQNIQINRILSSYGEGGLDNKSGLKDSEACFAGQSWIWDGVLFEMLNPGTTQQQLKRNDTSCVLRVTAGDQAILLSGDIEKKTEFHLVHSYHDKLKADYLVVPHHGSKTSSSQLFLDAVKPKFALIPVGYRNRYRMPHPSVVHRYRENGIKIYKTSSSGAISLRFGQKSSSYLPQEYRKLTLKYWNSLH